LERIEVKRVAIYARVSTEEQTTENQILILEKEAERRGWTFKTFSEVESSRNQRPIKAKLLEKLRNREFDGVLVLKLDRWARSMRELLREVEELYEKRIAFISLHDHIDLATPSGKLQFQILAAFAEFERNIISQRTKEGLQRKRETCIHCGHNIKRHKERGCSERGCDCKKFEGWVPHRGKDKRPRRRSGYWARYAGKRKETLKRKRTPKRGG